MANTSSRTRGKVIPFRYFDPAKRRATQYEEVTMHVQWDPKNYASQGWFNLDHKGRPAWDDETTVLKAGDWWAYRDPSEEWFRPFVNRQAETGDSIERAIEGARRADMFSGFMPRWRDFLATHYAVYRYPEYGLFMSLCYAQREALSDVVSSPMVFQGLEKDRHAQDITLYCMALESELEGFSDESCKSLWMDSPIWQPTREVVELLMASRDWGEINFVINLIYEPLLAALFSRDLVMRFAPRHGDSVTPVIAEGAENDRQIRQLAASALAKFLIEQDPGNSAIMEGWVALWLPRILSATAALAPLFNMADIEVDTFEAANARVTAQWRALMVDIGLKTPSEVAA